MLNYKTILTNKTQLTPDVYLLKFRLVEPEEIDFRAGQYLILDVPQTNGNAVKRLYSIASPPTEKNSFELLIKIVENGIGTNYLKNLEINSEVKFSGPAGMFGLKEDNKDKIFLATGTGLAPLRSIIKMLSVKHETLKVNQPKIILFWGLQKISDCCLIDELKQYATNLPGFGYKICLSREENLDGVNKDDRQNFTLGRITKGFDELIGDKKELVNNFDYYFCGNRDVVESVRTFLNEKGANKENLYFERY